MNIPPEIRDRFLSKLSAPDENGCIIWRGTMQSNGYGCFWWNRKTCLAHRLSVAFSGREIPDGYHVDHLCRVTRCVNPDHLEPVTPGENARRGETFARRNLAKTHCPKGHPLSSDNLDSYALKSGRRACKICMRERCRTWHHKNRDTRLASMKAYKARMKENGPAPFLEPARSS